jgi:ketosteroid isomerase-like protein
MYEALSRLYERKHISQNLTLINQLHNMKMDNSESVTSYFMRVSQIRDHLVAIGDVISEKELVTTTLNGFPTFWIPFVQGVCARSKLPKFDKLWEDCTHEESRLVDQQKRLIVNEEEALTAQKNK